MLAPGVRLTEHYFFHITVTVTTYAKVIMFQKVC